jgi:hypothetical protein
MHRQPTAIRLPPLVQRGTLQRMDHPDRALSPEHQDRLFITTGARTSTLSYRSRAIIALIGGRKASIIGLPLAWNAGGIGVKEPALTN